MGASLLQPPTAIRAAQTAPGLIGIGLSVFVLSVWWPVVPVITAFALVALGATGSTLTRFRGRASGAPVLMLHLAIYGSLYALFIGATLHAHARDDAGSGHLAAVDLVASIWPVAIATRLVVGRLLDSRATD